jgi:hypothetical protein
MVKKILLAVVAIVVVFIVVVALQPSEFRVERSTMIDAPAADVFAQVNDFHAWQAWSPWAKLDPAAKSSYEGHAAGTGAIFRWSGNSEVGEGSMKIIESQPNDLVKIALEFIRPFSSNNSVEFSFQPEAEQTKVTWAMSGHNSFMGKAFGLFMNMDKMVGGEFDQGLAQMKAVMETAKNKKPTVEPRDKAS